jgi:hypothetical protein
VHEEKIRMEFACEGHAKFEAPFLQKADIYNVPKLDQHNEEEREEVARRLREIGSSAQDVRLRFYYPVYLLFIRNATP